MPAYAARVGDTHPKGPILKGCDTVIIGGKPAARMGDKAACGSGFDVIAEGEATVIIGGRPAARMGDEHSCGKKIGSGCTTVVIGKDLRAACLRAGAADGTMIVETSVE